MIPRCAILALVLAGCGHEMSDREYCVRRDMGWEMAFPTLDVSEADRAAMIEACVANVADARASGELARSIACMNEHLVGHGHAYEQYVAFTRCEVVDPSRPHQAPARSVGPPRAPRRPRGVRSPGAAGAQRHRAARGRSRRRRPA
jgi:hypothetical protein